MSILKVNTLEEATSRGATFFTAKAWVNFNGTGTVAIRDDGNVSSITDRATGEYTVSFTSSMTSGSYSVNNSSRRTSTNSTGYGTLSQSALPTSTECRVASVFENGTLSDSDILCTSVVSK